jgi:tRNA(Ile)-lysidine synthase
LNVNKNASAADDTLPISPAEANWLFRTLSPYPVLIVAVSGGPDSTALMGLLARWRSGLERPPRLVAVTIDHALRAQSKGEAKVVEQLAGELGIEHWTMRWSERKPKTGLMQAARLARYRLLSEAARKAGATHVITAHTRDDQAETVLIRMARGSGISGLAGMAPFTKVPVKEGRGLALVRPLLDIPKSRLIATLKEANVPYADDPTNRDPQFTRSRFRELMPLLAAEGLTASRLVALASRVQRIEDALTEVLDIAQANIAPEPWPIGGPVTMDARAVFDLPHEIALRLLGRAIAWAGSEGPVELGKLEALYASMAEPLSAAMLHMDQFAKFRRTLAGAVVGLDGGRIIVEQAPPRAAVRRGTAA